MRYFFIDLENVRSAGLEGVLSLDSEDRVFIFYSENANNLTIPTLENINSSKATVKFINTNFIGSNAMDFQIVSLLGAMIERNKKGFFAIISHDNGFKSALTFCERYFTDYDIKLGEFENIISAIAFEIKQNGKNNDSSKASIKKIKKQDEAHTKDGKKQKDTSETAVITGRRENKKTEENKQVEEKQEKQPRKNPCLNKQDNKKQENNKQENNNQGVKKQDNKKQESKKQESKKQENKKDLRMSDALVSSDMGYIYEHLKELLSERTIDIYASKIHEAMLVSNSKDDLHRFFKEKCGDDEGEALYKLIQGDFEVLKRKARK